MGKDLVDRALALLTVEAAQPTISKDEAQNFRPEAGPILAVKIGGSVIGDYWLVLDDTEPFDPGDGLPVYRPSEIRALKGKGYGLEALQSVNRVKTVFDGTLVQ
jgi:hypothetical protein